MNAVLRTIDTISGISGRIAAWILAPLIFAMVYEVAARYLFNAPTIWAFEVGYMAMGANFLLGAAYALRERAHIRIDVAYSHFPPRIKAAIDVIGYGLVFLPFSIWLSWRLALYAHGSWESGEHTGASAWSPLIWPLRAVFALGFVLLSLQAIAELVRSLRMLATGVDPQAS